MQTQEILQSLDPPRGDPAFVGTLAHRRSLARLSASMNDALHFDRATAFLVEALDPLTQDTVGLLVDLVVEDDVTESRRQTWFDRMTEHAHDRGWSAVSASLFPETAALLEPQNGTVSARIRKRTRAQSPVPDDLSIASAGPADRSACHAMLVDALAHGNQHTRSTPNLNALFTTHAEKLLDLATLPRGLHLVARLDHIVVGHALGLLDSPCIRSGLEDAVLIDAYTLPDFRNRGFSAALARAWESAAFDAGARTLRGSVSGPQHKRILVNLHAHGWEHYATEWVALPNIRTA